MPNSTVQQSSSRGRQARVVRTLSKPHHTRHGEGGVIGAITEVCTAHSLCAIHPSKFSYSPSPQTLPTADSLSFQGPHLLRRCWKQIDHVHKVDWNLGCITCWLSRALNFSVTQELFQMEKTQRQKFTLFQYLKHCHSLWVYFNSYLTGCPSLY